MFMHYILNLPLSLSAKDISPKILPNHNTISTSQWGAYKLTSAQVKGLDLQEALGHLPTAKVSQFLEASCSRSDVEDAPHGVAFCPTA